MEFRTILSVLLPQPPANLSRATQKKLHPFRIILFSSLLLQASQDDKKQGGVEFRIILFSSLLLQASQDEKQGGVEFRTILFASLLLRTSQDEKQGGVEFRTILFAFSSPLFFYKLRRTTRNKGGWNLE